MSPGDLATTSDTLAWLAVVSYVVAATLFGLEFAYRARWFGVAGLTVTVAGLAANVGAAVTRGLAVHRVPWGNMYEFSIIVGIITVSGFLIWLSRRPDIRPLGMFVLLPAVNTAGDPKNLIPAVRGVIRELDPEIHRPGH